MEKASEKNVASSSQKFEIDKLSEAVEQQKAELDRLRWLLDNIGTGNLSFSPHGMQICMIPEHWTSLQFLLFHLRSFSELCKFIPGINCWGVFHAWFLYRYVHSLHHCTSVDSLCIKPRAKLQVCEVYGWGFSSSDMKAEGNGWLRTSSRTSTSEF